MTTSLIYQLAEQCGATKKASLEVYQFYGFELEQFVKLLAKHNADWIREHYDHPHAEGLAWNLEIYHQLHGDYA